MLTKGIERMIELVETPKKIVAELGLGEPIEIDNFSLFIMIYKYSKNGVVYEIEQHISGAFDIRLIYPADPILRDAVLEIAPYTNIFRRRLGRYKRGEEVNSTVYVAVNQRDRKK
jgi:hypothetical protein